ncbi:MAG: hypothetical protein OQK45_06685 [Sulfurovum sp.]|nr:hypothetical protein [Sulfurovum sp.]
MKNLLFSVLLGSALLWITGCGEDSKTETKKSEAPAMKCGAGKCGTAMGKDVSPAADEGKCGEK